MSARPRVVIAPDAYKGCLPAYQVASAIAAGIRRVWPSADCILHPMADGGEGTLAAIAAAIPVRWHHEQVDNLEGVPGEAGWISLPDGLAVIESALVVGLPLVTTTRVDQRSSAGLGQLLIKVLEAGHRRILLGLGGTGTNDGGAGFLQALGAQLRDVAGQPLDGTLASLADLATLTLGDVDPRLAQCDLQVMADVASPLTGSFGATAVFGPQKGVLTSDIARFDGYLARLGALGDALLGQSLATMPGSGAAGGLGWALRLLGASLTPGAALIADLQCVDTSLRGAQCLITGEGHTDQQTLLGKVPWYLADRAARLGVPAVLLSGGISQPLIPQLAKRFSHCRALCEGDVHVADAMRDAVKLLADRAESMARSGQLG